mmetsp:Transcript_59280/g.71316  ORF Transcript_59280/g.71316 Transcript_59280/m.71316 type:complete len:111 (+) Transcript_59280:6-338(+)
MLTTCSSVPAAIVKLQRQFRALRILRRNLVSTQIPKIAFFQKPFPADVTLTGKYDRKLFRKGPEGLGKDDKFDGKQKGFTNFMKLMKVAKETVKGMEIITISTVFDSMHT